jgi:hypothetical protein
MVQRTEVGFRVHQPTRRSMIRIGRGVEASISVDIERRDDRNGPLHALRRIHESRRFLAITETSSGAKNCHVAGAREIEAQQRSMLAATSFIFSTRFSGPRMRRASNRLKKDVESEQSEANKLWDIESEPNMAEEPNHTVSLHLRGGCLKLPERQGTKRRLSDDDQLPTLVWWVAGGRPRHKPLNGKQLREWKRESDGYQKGNKKRIWVREFAFAMTSGRVGRNSEKPKSEGSQDAGNQDEGGENAGDTAA